VKKLAGICTQNLMTSKENVLDWIAWHRAQGVNQAWLDVNQLTGSRIMAQKLARAVENDSLVLVNWE
jgi:hypothetical protein